MVLALAIRLADRGFCMGGADTDDTTKLATAVFTVEFVAQF